MSHKPLVNPSILVSTLKRNHVDSEITKPFGEFSLEIQQSIIGWFIPKLHEQLVILNFSNFNQWLLLSTERIIWKNNLGVKTLDYVDIKHVGLDRNKVISREFNRNGFCYKRDSTDIQLILKNGEKLTINVGESAARFGFIQALGWAICKSDGRLP